MAGPVRSNDELGEAMTLIMSIPKKYYLVGEPIIANFKLVNQSSQDAPRYFRDNEDFAFEEFQMTMKGENHPKPPVVRLPHSCITHIGTIYMRTVVPGEFWQCDKVFLPAVELDGPPGRSYGHVAKG
jgi:hypothetical protein